MSLNLKNQINKMDVKTWREYREALELEHSLREEAEQIQSILDAGKNVNDENRTSERCKDDLASYFDVENRN